MRDLQMQVEELQCKEEELKQRPSTAERRLHGPRSAASESSYACVALVPPPLGAEMGQLASITTVPSLRQRLQTIPQSNADDGNHTLISWLMAAVRTVWESAGDLPEHVSKWTTYLDLAQVVREMGMPQVMFSLYFRSPDDELLTARMKDFILVNGPWERLGLWRRY
ncbi:hypothetical protein Cadr_000012736 [Camelus dromedarius]|uniref:Uncharacterized protein n=1 Tax=Camelus dromedarius TaxID=9838 RepID=A0A5N4D9X2_CAMDR|nr:hypothetical protein Cadr_000012736 [Camelus dromedarius]